MQVLPTSEESDEIVTLAFHQTCGMHKSKQQNNQQSDGGPLMIPQNDNKCKHLDFKIKVKNDDKVS